MLKTVLEVNSLFTTSVLQPEAQQLVGLVGYKDTVVEVC